MELGEIQKAWIKSLRENRHKQYKMIFQASKK